MNTRDRSTLGSPLGVDGPWLAAILGALDDIADMLAERLPPPPDSNQAPAVVAVTEPRPAPNPAPAVVAITEPARPVVPDPPPRMGRGASADAWRDWAHTAGVTLPDGASRADIITACQQAGVLNTQQ